MNKKLLLLLVLATILPTRTLLGLEAADWRWHVGGWHEPERTAQEQEQIK
jgi:hypothetical protein